MKHLMYKNHFSLTIEAGSYSKNYKSSEIPGADPWMLLRAIETHSKALSKKIQSQSIEPFICFIILVIKNKINFTFI